MVKLPFYELNNGWKALIDYGACGNDITLHYITPILLSGSVMHPIPQKGILSYKRRKKRGAQAVGNSVEES